MPITLRHEIVYRDELKSVLESVDRAGRIAHSVSPEFRAGWQEALACVAAAWDISFQPLPVPNGVARMLMPDERG